MKVGITGHQERVGIDWLWVREAIDAEFERIDDRIWGISSLAKGTDQVFAEAVLARGGHLIAVIPIVGYEQFFDGDALSSYQSLFAKAKVVHLNYEGDAEEAFLKAGHYIADHSDLLIAVWDGAPSKGLGGTADIVQHVQRQRIPWIHVNPLLKAVVRYV